MAMVDVYKTYFHPFAQTLMRKSIFLHCDSVVQNIPFISDTLYSIILRRSVKIVKFCVLWPLNSEVFMELSLFVADSGILRT